MEHIPDPSEPDLERLTELLADPVMAGQEARSGPTVHLIDAAEESLVLLCEFLSKAGFRVSGSSDPRRALDYLQRVHPEVLICPEVLDEMDVEEFVRSTLLVSPETRILLTDARVHAPWQGTLELRSGGSLPTVSRDASALLHAVEEVLRTNP